MYPSSAVAKVCIQFFKCSTFYVHAHSACTVRRQIHCVLNYIELNMQKLFHILFVFPSARCFIEGHRAHHIIISSINRSLFTFTILYKHPEAHHSTARHTKISPFASNWRVRENEMENMLNFYLITSMTKSYFVAPPSLFNATLWIIYHKQHITKKKNST